MVEALSISEGSGRDLLENDRSRDAGPQQSFCGSPQIISIDVLSRPPALGFCISSVVLPFTGIWFLCTLLASLTTSLANLPFAGDDQFQRQLAGSGVIDVLTPCARSCVAKCLVTLRGTLWVSKNPHHCQGHLQTTSSIQHRSLSPSSAQLLGLSGVGTLHWPHELVPSVSENLKMLPCNMYSI